MRKTWCSILGVLVLALGAPSARADTLYTYTYTFTVGPYELTFTTVPIAAVTAQTYLSPADIASYALTGSYWAGTELSSADLDSGDLPGAIAVYSTGNHAISGGAGEGFTLADYAIPGTYAYGTPTYPQENILTVTAVATPEPATLGLILIGTGLVFVMRKRVALHPPQST